MRISGRILLVSLLLLLIISCGMNRVEQKEERVELPKLPWYITNPPKNTEQIIYGTGSGLSLEEARENARKEISQYFRSYIESEYNSHLLSITEGGDEDFLSYVNSRLEVLSWIEVRGTTIEASNQIDDHFYSLAQLDMKIFQLSQEKIIEEILAYVKLAEEAENPGRKLILLFQGGSLQVKVLRYFEINDKPSVVYFYESCQEILNQIDLDYSFIAQSDFRDDQEIEISMSYGNQGLSGFPIRIDDEPAVLDKRGKYQIQSQSDKPYTIVIEFDFSAIELGEGLQEKEKAQAIKLVRYLGAYRQDLRVVPPVDLSAYIQITHLEGGNYGENEQLMSLVTQALLSRGVKIAGSRDEAELLIEITTESIESSVNEYLGYCYQSMGRLQIENKSKPLQVIELSGAGVREATKNYGESTEQAARGSLEKLNELLLEELGRLELSGDQR